MVDTDLLDEILLCPVQLIHIAINVMEGHALVEMALQIAYCGQFAHRLTQPGYCKFTKQPVLYAVKPDRVINAAENLVRSVKKNLVNSVKNLLGREPQVLIAPRIFSSDDAPKDISSLYLPSNLKARVKNLSKSGNMFKFYAAL